MQGNSEIIAELNRLLTGELSAMDIYFVQSRIFENWGYSKLKERLEHEMEDERHHADLLIKRILFLEGVPDVASRTPFSIGGDAKKILEMDLALEHSVATHLNAVMALCEEQSDNGTRKLLDGLLDDTENDHVFWLESQLHLIEETGLQNYLQQQI